jgi:hypothetical protein
MIHSTKVRKVLGYNSDLPNPDFAHPSISSEAAEDLRKDRSQFASNVRRSLGGGVIKGVTYDRALK